MATPEIVRYFSKNTTEDFIEDLDPGHIFEYQNQTFEILEVRKNAIFAKTCIREENIYSEPVFRLKIDS